MAVTIELERELGDPVMGIDEAGRGPLVGGVYAAAVSVPLALAERLLAGEWSDGADMRNALLAYAQEKAPAAPDNIAYASTQAVEVDGATHLAMRRAADAVGAEHILVDGLPVKTLPQARSVVKGDAKSLLIAAASILAKTSRDADCLRLERLYPGYGFAKHKGYPTAAHLAALARLGPCPEHRMSFGPVKSAADLWYNTRNQTRGES